MRQIVLAMMILCGGQLSSMADDLGERVVWNGLLPGGKWEAAPGVSATADGTMLVLRCTGADYGWAAPLEVLPAMAGTRADLEIKQVANGQLTIQVEWLRNDGGFISATNILNQARSATAIKNQEIAAFYPGGEKPKKFRFKFWLEGKGAEAQLSVARVSSKLGWRKAGTTLVKSYGPKSATVLDAGMNVEPHAEALLASLAPATPFSAFAFDEKVAYDKKGTLLVDVAALRNGSLSVQAICWSDSGAYLKSVDLLKDVSSAGYYEVPLELKKDDFSADVAKLSFKVWLSGKDTSLRLNGLSYGVLP